jgi:hypothetical protein
VSIEHDFWQFHRENPLVYARLVGLARDLKRKGHAKLGIGMLFEVVRWQHMLNTHDPASEFKLNNNYRSLYARLIMLREEDLAGVFETRTLHRDSNLDLRPPEESSSSPAPDLAAEQEARELHDDVPVPDDGRPSWWPRQAEPDRDPGAMF